MATALPPNAATSIAFRQAVYTDPARVKLAVHDDDKAVTAIIIRVSEMDPGACFRVAGTDGYHVWTALLTCGVTGLFTVTNVSSRPREQL